METSENGERSRLATYFIPHGAGPCFFMDWSPRDAWKATARWLASIGKENAPRAILVISAHWEADDFTVTAAPRPSLIYDYYGFPDHTYALEYPAPGDPRLAGRVHHLLTEAGLPSRLDEKRGFDHGVFVPLLLIEPKAGIPVVQLSLRSGLDAKEHFAAGRALAPLRDEGVLIVGSGMSFHNMRGFANPAFTPISRTFDGWLARTISSPPGERERLLAEWAGAPAARQAHPREEHLLPLMVAAGAALDDPGAVAFTDTVMEVAISGARFG